jgi:hypothetical protein
LFLSPENPAHDILLVGYISTFRANLLLSQKERKKEKMSIQANLNSLNESNMLLFA